VATRMQTLESPKSHPQGRGSTLEVAAHGRKSTNRAPEVQHTGRAKTPANRGGRSGHHRRLGSRRAPQLSSSNGRARHGGQASQQRAWGAGVVDCARGAASRRISSMSPSVGTSTQPAPR
jgi:hypothetical protein